MDRLSRYWELFIDFYAEVILLLSMAREDRESFKTPSLIYHQEE